MSSLTNAISKQDAKQVVLDQDIQYVKIGLFDLNGILRSKTVSRAKFLSILEHGGSFYDGIFAADIDDQLMNCMRFSGEHTGYPDAKFEVVVDSARQVPWEEDSVFFLCQFSEGDNVLCPRSVLGKVIGRAEKMGFFPFAGMEYEFTIFNENADSIRDKNHQDLLPISPGNFGYSLLRTSLNHELCQQIVNMSTTMKMPLECLHTEVGPGMFEGALAPASGIVAADNAALFKNFCKVLLAREDLIANFMAKWHPKVQGHGAHIHISLFDKQDNSVFYDAKHEVSMSKTMRHFVAGQQALMAEFLVLCAPTINSYARYVPGCWAPTEASWAPKTRAVSLRVVPGGAKSQRVEYRIPGADCNPYLAFAAALASGLYGIEHELALPPAFDPAKPDATHANPLPTNLRDATRLFADSTVANELFGEAFVQDYVASREFEVLEYEKAVTDWQLKRYFEII